MSYAKYPSGGTVTTLTASGSTHTKGSYGEIVASTSADASRWWFNVRNAGTGDRMYLIDLAKGAGGAETVIVADVNFDAGADVTVSLNAQMDVDIPASTRLAGRCQSGTGSATVDVWLLAQDRALATISNPVTYGAVTASSRGTQIDPGGTANTESAYVQYSASSTADASALCVVAAKNSQGDTIAAFQHWRVDVAHGPGGSEVVDITDLTFCCNGTGNHVTPAAQRYPIANIASGTRLAMRAQCSVNTATDRIIALELITMQDPDTDFGGGSGSSTETAVGFFG